MRRRYKNLSRCTSLINRRSLKCSNISFLFPFTDNELNIIAPSDIIKSKGTIGKISSIESPLWLKSLSSLGFFCVWNTDQLCTHPCHDVLHVLCYCRGDFLEGKTFHQLFPVFLALVLKDRLPYVTDSCLISTVCLA